MRAEWLIARHNLRYLWVLGYGFLVGCLLFWSWQAGILAARRIIVIPTQSAPPHGKIQDRHPGMKP
jgi:hypothetical protein